MVEESLILAARAVNGIVTLLIGLIIANRLWQGSIRERGKVLFAIGFLVYGVQILLRVWLPLLHPAILALTLTFLIVLAGAMGTLKEKFPHFVLGAVGALAIGSIGTYLVPQYRQYLLLMSLLFYYSMMAYGGFSLSRAYGTMAYKFALGWALLLIVNTMFLLVEDAGPQVASDILAVMAKLVVLSGIMDSRFWATTAVVRHMTKPIADMAESRREKYGSVTLASSRSWKNFWEWITHVAGSSQKYERILIGAFYIGIDEEEELKKTKILENPKVTRVVLVGDKPKLKLPNSVYAHNLNDFVVIYTTSASAIAEKQRILCVLRGISLLARFQGEHHAASIIRDIALKMSTAGADIYLEINPLLTSENLKVSLERFCERYIDLDAEVRQVLKIQS